MSRFSRFAEKSTYKNEVMLCEWMIKHIRQGSTRDQILGHVKECPICGPAIAGQKNQRHEKYEKRNEAIFNEAVLDLGGALDKSIFPHNVQSMFSNIDYINRKIINIINKQELEKPVATELCGDIFIGHVSNSDLNAVAFIHKDHELVGLYAGLTFAINILSCCLFGCPDFLKRTFPTKKGYLSVMFGMFFRYYIILNIYQGLHK